MDRPKVGLMVKDVRGRTIGAVSFVNHCCVEVAGRRAVITAGIAGISFGELELICDADQIGRYACLIHLVQPVNDEIQVR